MPRIAPRTPLAALALVLAGALAGCSSTNEAASPSGSTSFFNMFRGGTAVPPQETAGTSTALDIDDIECPSVDVLDGGASIRNQSAAGDVRSQLSLGQTARECRLVGDQISIKIGVEGLALLGPMGTPGTFSVPVRFVAKRGERVLVSRLQRSSVTIPAGQAQASFVMIEDNIMVPAVGPDLELIVGFDPHGRAEPAPRKTKSR